MTTPSKPPVNRTSLAATIGNTHRRTRGLEAAQMMPYYASRSIWQWGPSEVKDWSAINTTSRSTAPFMDYFPELDEFYEFNTDEHIFEPAVVDPYNPSDGQYQCLNVWGEGLFQWNICVTASTTGATPGPWIFRAVAIWQNVFFLTDLLGPDINEPNAPYWDDSGVGEYYGKCAGDNLRSQFTIQGIFGWDPFPIDGTAPYVMPRQLQILLYKGLASAAEPTANLNLVVDLYIERLTPIAASAPSE
jgi:hypothetical protein